MYICEYFTVRIRTPTFVFVLQEKAPKTHFCHISATF